MEFLILLVNFAFVLQITQAQGETVFTRPQILLEIQASHNPAPLGEQIVLTCIQFQVGGATGTSTTWLFNNNRIRDDSGVSMVDNTLIISPFRDTQAGQYQCLREDTVSATLDVDFTIWQPEISVHMNVPVPLDESFMMTCSTNALGVAFEWTREKELLQTETSSVLSGTMTHLDAGSYACRVVKAPKVSAYSNHVSIDFKVPTPSIVLSAGGPKFPLGATIRFDCFNSYINENVSSKIFWFLDGVVIEDRNSAYFTDGYGLILKQFGGTLEGSYSCVQEIQGRQSERSKDVAIAFSVAEIILQTSGGQIYNVSTPPPILVGTDLELSCNKDIDYLEIEDVTWWANSMQMDRSSAVISFTMEAYLSGQYECRIKYRDQAGESAISKPTHLEFGVPNPQLKSSNGKTLLFLGENIELNCVGVDTSVTNTVRYFWFRNGLGATRSDNMQIHGSSLVIDGFLESNLGSYTCKMDINGVVSEKSNEIVIGIIVPEIKLQMVVNTVGMLLQNASESDKIPLGSSFTLECVDDAGYFSKIATILWRQSDIYWEETQSTNVLTATMDPWANGNITCQYFNTVTLISGVSLPLHLSYEVPQPTIVLHKDEHLLYGSEFTLDCRPVYTNPYVNSTFRWYRDGTEVKGSEKIQILTWGVTLLNGEFQEKDAGSYTCDQDVNGVVSVKSEEIYIDAIEPSLILTMLSGDYTDLNETTQVSIRSEYMLQCLDSSHGDEKTEWTINGQVVNGNDDFEIKGLSEPPGQRFNYTCIKIYKRLRTRRATLDVIVQVPQPHVTGSGGSSYELGSEVVLTCWNADIDVASVSAHDIRWFGDDSELHPSIDAITKRGQTLILNFYKPVDAVSYTCIIEIDGISSSRSNPFSITYTVPKPNITTDNHQIFIGSDVQLACSSYIDIDHSHVPIHQWYRDGVEIDPESDFHYHKEPHYLYIDEFQPHHAGSYECREVVRALWSMRSDAVDLIATRPAPVVRPEADEIVTALGTDLDLSCFTDGSVDNVEWMKDDSLLSSSVSILAYDMSPAVSGVFTCRFLVAGVWSLWSEGRYVTFKVPRPSIASNASNSGVNLGQPLMVTCNSGYHNDDVKTREVTWTQKYNNDVNLSKFIVDDNSLVIPSMTMDYVTNYRCKETIENITSNHSRRWKIDILVPPPTIVDAPTQVLFNQSVEFSCSRGYGHKETKSKIIWFKDGHAIDFNSTNYDQEDSLLRIERFGPANEGLYSCEDYINDNKVSSKSEGVHIVFIVPAPNIEVFDQAGIMYSTPQILIPLGAPFETRCQTEIQGAEFNWRRNNTTLSQTRGVLGRVMNLGNVGSYDCRVSFVTADFVSASEWSPKISIMFSVPQPAIIHNTTSPMLGDAFYLECSSGFGMDHNENVFRWFKNGAVLDTEDGEILEIPSFVSTSGGEYECQEIIQDVHSGKSSKLEIGFEVPTPGLDTPEIEGDIATLRCVSNHQSVTRRMGAGDIIWFLNDQPLNRTSHVLAIDINQQELTGHYHCREVVGSVMSNESSRMYIEFKDNAINPDGPSPNTTDIRIDHWPVINSSSQSTVPEKSTIKLGCLYENYYQEQIYYWYNDVMQISSTNKSTYVIKGFSAMDDGNYSCGILNNGEVRRSQSIPLIAVDANALCTCPCGNSTKAVVMNETEIEEVVSSIKKNLTMDTTSLSAKVRAKTSAPDSRPASISCGAVAAVFIILVPVLFVTFDCINLVNYVVRTKQYSLNAN